MQGSHARQPVQGRQKQAPLHAQRPSQRHLSAIAGDARLSRSEALERLIRATPVFEGSAVLANGAWKLAVDYAAEASNETIDPFSP
jgi:hypothetical protein